MHAAARSLAFLLCVGLGGTAVAQELAAFASRVRELTLDNGMRFIIVERHDAPVVSCSIRVAVGSVDEHVGITGLAHLFEHLAFKGTPRIGTRDYRKEQRALERLDAAYEALSAAEAAAPAEERERLQAAFSAAQVEAESFIVKDEFDTAYQAVGAVGLNAGTSADSTEYVVSMPSNQLELWAYLESERLLQPVLREFYKERDVVMEERRAGESDPVSRLVEEFLAAAYKAHPYGQPVIGHMSDLENLRRADAERFYREHYVPQAMTVAVVGDVDPDAAAALVERYFGRIPRGPEPKPLRTVEPPQLGEKVVTIEDPSQPFYMVGYHKPAKTDPDDAVFDAITDLLAGGRTSRLHRSLVKDLKIAVETGAFPGFPGEAYPNLFIFYAFPAVGHSVDEVAAAIDAESERLKAELASAEELAGLKTRARADLVRRLASNAGMASLLADEEALSGDWRELFRSVDRIEALSLEDIQRVARTTFNRKNRVVGRILTEETAP